MVKSASKTAKFFIFIFAFMLCFFVQFFYIISQKHSMKVLQNFTKITSVYTPSFYSSFIRYRDLNNVDILFSNHFALPQMQIGSFFYQVPLKHE